MLIGVDVSEAIVLEERRGNRTGLYALKTCLDQSLIGPRANLDADCGELKVIKYAKTSDLQLNSQIKCLRRIVKVSFYVSNDDFLSKKDRYALEKMKRSKSLKMVIIKLGCLGSRVHLSLLIAMNKQRYG